MSDALGSDVIERILDGDSFVDSHVFSNFELVDTRIFLFDGIFFGVGNMHNNRDIET
jgi:hypothetical protein